MRHATPIKPKKSLGQHFLRCQWVVDTLIHAGELTKQDTVLEIGPGTGVLTRALGKHAGTVLAVEKDEKLAQLLRKSLREERNTNVEIIEGDVLQLLPSFFSRYTLHATRYKLISNIPYYLTSRMLRMVFESSSKPCLVVLTIQKEVAERIAAHPPDMSILALSVQAYGRPEIIKTVPASCFYPPPQVDSAIIKISGISDSFFTSYSVPEKYFFRIIKIGFASKRKQLAGNLSRGLKMPREKTEEILKSAGINPKQRAEELTLENASEEAAQGNREAADCCPVECIHVKKE